MPASRYDPDTHHRRSVRLREYDYAQEGAYCVTLCTHQGLYLFGDIVEGAMVLGTVGHIVAAGWARTPEIRQGVELDAYIVMPNHLHGIVVITAPERVSPKPQRVGRSEGVYQYAPTGHTPSAGEAPPAPPRTGAPRTSDPLPRTGVLPYAPVPAGHSAPPPQTLGAIVRGFKAATTASINTQRHTRGAPVWLRNYYEHVIRDADDLDRIRAYIAANPTRWAEDTLRSPRPDTHPPEGGAPPRRGKP